MVKFTTTILKFGEQGEKTGWTYIVIPSEIAEKIKAENKKSFRVKGKLDDCTFSKTALLPMGGGDFILPLNAAIRKAIGKRKGAELKVQMEEDKTPLEMNKDLMECLRDEPTALKFFESLANSHRNYFSKWIETAKTDATKAKRIAQAVNAFSKSMNFPEMLRALKKEKELMR